MLNKLSLISLIIAITCITIGVAKQVMPPCEKEVEIKYLEPDVYNTMVRVQRS